MAAVVYVVVIVSASFGGREVTRSYAFACPPKTRGRHNLSVVEEEVDKKRESGTNYEEVKLREYKE